MTNRFQLDTTHSSVDFSIRHLVIAKVRGRFTKFSGTVDIDETDITRSVVSAQIEASSISTNDDKRDAHLRSPDFLDVEKFPHLSFVSTRVEQKGSTLLLVTGALSIHGVTREVSFEVEQLGTVNDPWGNKRIAFAAHGAIDRKDFGLQWNQVLEAGGVLVGDKIEISLDIEGVRAAAQAAA